MTDDCRDTIRLGGVGAAAAQCPLVVLGEAVVNRLSVPCAVN